MSSTIYGIDNSLLLSYYSAQLSQASAYATAAQSSTASSPKNTSSTSATANDVTPWSGTQPSQEARDAQVLNMKSFIDSSNVPLSAGVSTDSKTEQDNQKLFALYNAVNNLSYLAVMAKRDGTTDGQLAGYNTRFQAGLTEIQNYIAKTNFNLFTLQAEPMSSSATSTATVPTATFSYTGSVLANGNTVTEPLSGVSAADSFTVSVSQGGSTTNLDIDLSKVQGDLTMGNIVSYVNDQLSAAGFSTRFKKDLVSGTIDTTSASKSSAQYAMQVVPGGVEQVSLSANTSAPALYVSGTSGTVKATSDTAVDNQGRITKITGLDDPDAIYSRTMAATNTGGATATSTAVATVVDSSGNAYMLGNSTGDIGNQLNQGAQDAYLTKYDSAGNVVWSKLVGSAGTANAGSLALNPKGGVVVVGSTTAQLSATALSNGNQDSFAVSYDANGNQQWTTQIPTLNTNAANAVSVDSSGNVYIGGQTNGVIASGQTSSGGQDAYVTKLDAKGKIVYKQQFGTTGSDSVAATALNANGDLFVASTQNGHAMVSKYAGGDATQPPVWTMDVGDLQYGGTIGGLVVKDNQVYVSGTTRNSALNAPSASGASGGTDAFVFSATDNNTSVTANHVSYVGTAGDEQGGGLTVGSDGTVYLAGTTNSTFAGEVRTAGKTTNMFVAAVGGDGKIDWTHQYGGMDGQSTGTGIALANTGSSVLDALGLPTGKISGQQNSDLTSATTLRPGDFFKVQIMGDAGRTFQITIDKGETLNSLVTKINAQFGSKGKASINYTSTGAALQIQVSPGVTAKLLPGTSDNVVVAANKSTGSAGVTTTGSADLDALGRLGITAQTLSSPATTSSSTSASTASTSTSNTYALGLASNLSIATTSGATVARGQLLTVLSAIQSAYQKSNNSASATSTTSAVGNNTPLSPGASAYYNSVNQDMNMALSLLTA